MRDAPVRVFVVWEPVLPTDWGPPSTSTLARVHDLRAAQFWDRRHLLSESLSNRFRALGGPEHFAPADSMNKIEFEMGKVIWDFIALFPPGSDRPSITAAPVVQGIDDIRAALAKVSKS
ncbi:MAG: hypothetical protein DMG57_19650 [Acidobacteria bacterium]|nr:MAG: hypothetical protein DMG57_19650 [Acidobacteriota bacterium]